MKTKAIISKLVTFCVMVGLLVPVGFLELSAYTSPGTIPIIPRPNAPVGAPRTPVYNPFFAQVEDNTIWLGCSSSYGSVDVELVSTAGDYSLTVFDTDDGLIMIPISGDSGHYTLTLTSESGMTFVGEFDL